ncbi:MAG: aromatic amino acid lyase [Myxococcota bacterium]|nr:aromatic amino acid lyase [Myxococcota bacterium]
MIVLNGQTLNCKILHRIAHGEAVSLDQEAIQRMEANANTTPSTVLEAKRRWIIGSQTKESEHLNREFILSHCAGVGEPLPESIVRAAMAARINVLATGHTGSRPIAALKMLELLNRSIIPIVPAQGSVGAAGDLAPMAHIARVVCGYGPYPADYTPLVPTSKETLSLINGVSLSAGIAALAIVRAERLFEIATYAAALTMETVYAQSQCIDPRVLSLRGHPECVEVGQELGRILHGSQRVQSDRNPDAFSIRCGPSVMGAILNTIRHSRMCVDRELNGCSDNPLLIEGEWLEAGHFHGSQIGLAMDHLKIALTQLATLSERRTFRLTHEKLSKNLPSFLVKGNGLNSGFMLAQYTAAALASECKGLAHPASVDTIPTVQHHEDHVSMAPIAARHCLQTIDCLTDILSIELLLGAQALDLRKRDDQLPHPPIVQTLHQTIRKHIHFWDDDQVLHPSLSAMRRLITSGELLQHPETW